MGSHLMTITYDVVRVHADSLIRYLLLSQRLGTSDFPPNYPHLLSLLVLGTPPLLP